MAKLHALRTLVLIGLLIALQCLARPELRTAWIVTGTALGLLAATGGAANLLSGQYRGD
jgi:hypothetical protein